MKFLRLRLSGFKSFVEPTEFLVEPGLTGIVGPNGCGKSNLLEGLRWVMGESSYKSMRASGMEDVIFDGSANRPRRNMAEVTVYLDNSSRTAPTGFNDCDQIEVSRRIERETGSTYRINAKEVRARDVQLLFADASTGSRSPALVRQGQINEIISAKPQSRRRILEEAAGITGLRTRRHEAELKLSGTENNLARLDDIVGQLEQQLAGLKRQARQAARYRNLSGEIRKLEAARLYASWRSACDLRDEIARELDKTAKLMAKQTILSSQANRAQLGACEKLPALREDEMVRAAVVQRLTVEKDNLEAEERRADTRRSELKERLRQIAEDSAREQEFLDETDAVCTQLDAEQAKLREAEAGDAKARAEAARAMQAAAAEMAQSQGAFDEANRQLSERAARREALERAAADMSSRLDLLKTEMDNVERRIEALGDDDGIAAEQQMLADNLARLNGAHADAGKTAEEAEISVRQLREEETKARVVHDEIRRKSDNLSTEVRTLTKMLSVADGELWPPLIDAITVDPGYETALGAALGEDLDAAGDNSAPVHWDELPGPDELAPLPGQVTALIDHVKGPACLTRRLSYIGVVTSEGGKRLQKMLEPGQRLVSLEGDLWRWDGYTAGAEAPTLAAKRLEERNRLGQLQKEADEASKKADEARAVHQAIREQLTAAVEAERLARGALRDKSKALEAARAALGANERKLADRAAKSSALGEAKRRLETSQREVQESLAAAQNDISGLEGTSALEAEIAALKQKAETDRDTYAKARAAHDGLEREAHNRAGRLDAICNEHTAWTLRVKKAGAHIKTLKARQADARKELDLIADRPTEWEAKRNKLQGALNKAQTERSEAADKLAGAERKLGELVRLEREAGNILAKTREDHARLEARFEAQEERLGETMQQIADSLACVPEEALKIAGFTEFADMPDIAWIETRLDKLKAERERLGGVNLRAGEEAEEAGKQIEELVSEREDVISAIGKLRGAIASLNREARQRLLGAFDTVNENFILLFTTLFGGGKAELKLTESDDPLEAGLEVYARPPGKRTQVMSLLSGGEQALSATALIFAVFLTNPSPICVLDEVDAPLDDANVERFCALLAEMCKKSDTRFLIITHNPLTMACMNRLFGVTMMEKGVSQLVSVDLDAAEQLLEAS